jgi:ribosomal protein L20
MVERKTGLHARARRARLEAVEHLGTDAQRFRAAIDRYTNAVEVADSARREWERLERPLWTKGRQGQLVEHPLVRTMDRVGAGGGGVRRLARADAHE